MYVLHRKGDTFTPEVHIEDCHGDLLMYLHHIGRIFHVPVGKLAYMNEAVLVDAYIHKNTEGRYIRNYARELHPRLHILHLLYPVLKPKGFKLFPGVTPRFGQLGHNVGQGRDSYRIGHIPGEVNGFSEAVFFYKVGDGSTRRL